jgi:hypothetical protein
MGGAGSVIYGIEDESVSFKVDWRTCVTLGEATGAPDRRGRRRSASQIVKRRAI